MALFRKRTPASPLRIGIFGYFGAWNLGDESVVDLIVRAIRRRHPGAQITGICLNPDVVKRTQSIDAIPLRRPPGAATAESSVPSGLWSTIARRLSRIAPRELMFLAEVYRQVGRFDLIVVGGSGQLVDNEGGAWNHPYNHLKWALMARLRGVPFAFLSVGVGPLFTPMGKTFVRWALDLAVYRSFRDEYSLGLARSIGVRGEAVVVPDQAFGLEAYPEAPRTGGQGQLVVGVAPIAYEDPRHWPTARPGAYDAYVAKMVEFCEWLLDAGHRLLFFHTQVHGDDRTMEEIVARLHSTRPSAGDRISVHRVEWFTHACQAIAATDICVVSRFHAAIFSGTQGKPVVAVSYDRKIDTAMQALGLGAYVHPIATFRVEDLRSSFTACLTSAQAHAAGVASSVARFRKSVDSQYVHVFDEETRS